MRVAASAASSGYSPTAVSAESITASAPSSTALATSFASALVGCWECCIDSSIWVATTAGTPLPRALRISSFCRTGISSIGSSTPRSPRATMMPSAHARMSSYAVMAGAVSILAMIGSGWRPMRSRSSWTSDAARTNDCSSPSTPVSRASSSPSRSRSVTAGSPSFSAGTFTPWPEPTLPERTTSVVTTSPSTEATRSSTAPSASRIRSPSSRSWASPSSPTARRCSSSEPWEKFTRKMSAPASASRTTASTPDVAGPRVHISLVLGAFRPSAPLGAGLTGSPPGSLPALDRRVGQRVRHLLARAGPGLGQPLVGNMVGQLGAGHLGEVDRPGAGNHRCPLVPAAAGGHPPPAGDLVREVVQDPRGFPVRPGGQLEVRQGVGRVRVAPQLRDQDVREKLADAIRDVPAEGVQPGLVVGHRRQRDVHLRAHRLAAPPLVLEAGAGEQVPPGLVDRDGEHARVLVEDRLGPVAVMYVHVDVRDAFHAMVQKPPDGDRGVVVDAEPRGPVGHRMVQPAGGVERVVVAAVQDPLRGDDGGTGDGGAGLVHVPEDRVVAGSVAEPRPVAAFPVAGPLRGVDKGLGVDQGDLVVGGDAPRRLGDVAVREDAVRTDQVPRQQHTVRPERMLRPVVVGAGLRRDDERDPIAHGFVGVRITR